MQPDAPDDRGAPSSGKLVGEAVMAERRALRAELVEETLQARAAAAERAVVSMEARLRRAEEAVAEARGERDALTGELVERERELRTARQGEFAERMVRCELEAEIAELREHVEVLAHEAERLEKSTEQARRAATLARRKLRSERAATAAEAAEAELVRGQVARRVDAVQATIADLRGELEDRVIAERGRAALALGRERELWEAAVEAERHRADGERAARHRAEAELGARVAAETGPALPGDLDEIRAADLRGLTRPTAFSGPTVTIAETVIADLARAADRLRAQVEEPEASRRRRRWWRLPWRRTIPASRARD